MPVLRLTTFAVSLLIASTAFGDIITFDLPDGTVGVDVAGLGYVGRQSQTLVIWSEADGLEIKTGEFGASTSRGSSWSGLLNPDDPDSFYSGTVSVSASARSPAAGGLGSYSQVNGSESRPLVGISGAALTWAQAGELVVLDLRNSNLSFSPNNDPIPITGHWTLHGSLAVSSTKETESHRADALIWRTWADSFGFGEDDWRLSLLDQIGSSDPTSLNVDQPFDHTLFILPAWRTVDGLLVTSETPGTSPEFGILGWQEKIETQAGLAGTGSAISDFANTSYFTGFSFSDGSTLEDHGITAHFSSMSAVPEPSSLALVAIATYGAWWKRRRLLLRTTRCEVHRG